MGNTEGPRAGLDVPSKVFKKITSFTTTIHKPYPFSHIQGTQQGGNTITSYLNIRPGKTAKKHIGRRDTSTQTTAPGQNITPFTCV
jgi:hypothetical protein